MSLSSSQLSKLRQIMANAKSGKNVHLAQSLFDDDVGDWFGEPQFDATSCADWIEFAGDIRRMFPAKYRSRKKSSRGGAAKIQVELVFASGEMHGTWTKGNVTQRVFFSINEDPSPAGCNCEESDGMEPCRHSFEFIGEVMNQLKKDGPLSKQIVEGKFAKGPPVHTSFQPDKSDLAISELGRIIDRSQEHSAAFGQGDDDVLPVNAQRHPGRLLWNFCESAEGYWSVQPLMQQKKKRGDGYTKGKKVPLDTLLADRKLPLTETDEAVVSLIQRNQEYYYRDSRYELDPFEAMVALVGQDNVALDHQPLQVIQYPIYMGIGSVDDTFKVVFTDDTGTRIFNRVVDTSDAFIRVDDSAGEVFVGPCDQTDHGLINSLIRLPSVSAQHLQPLVDSLAKLQSRLSILLPPNTCGKIVPVVAQPAILLRSQPDGTLDFGIRVRDAAGVLRKPLAGPMVVSSEQDGEKVQLLRSVQVESDQIESLLREWQLTVDQTTWFGTINDFGVALRLIEQLQSKDSGVEVLWDRTCEKPITVLGSLSNSNVKVEITNKRNWFGITGECLFDEHSMPLNELIKGLSSGEGDEISDYIKLADGQWARISEGLRQRLKRLQDATHSERNTLKLDATAAPAIRDLVDSDVAVKASRAWQQCIRRLADAEKLDPKVPKNLDANLRDYQVDGYKWLRKLAQWGVGGILADDMGLGKTLQTLAAILDRSEDGPTLVIAPTSVGFNWVREAERFAPDLDVHLYRETERDEFLPTVGPGALVICSYGLALRDAEPLSKVSWSTLVLDEAQAIKNSRSKTSKAIAGIDADWTVALTGTPVENHLGELWSLFHVVSPGVFGGWENFRKRFAAPIEKEGSESARKSLADRLQPFVLRRTKSEVLTELPPRTEMNLYVDLSPAERNEYEKIRLAAIGEIDALEALPHLQDQRFKILALMTRLRQIACHAGLVNKQWTASSAKLDQLCETLESLREEGHRALIFSQFTEHLALIRSALDERGFTYEYLDGSTPAKARQVAVDQFQSGTADCFLISLKAGGTGLNLTAADYVIHMDPWWNPAVEDQATDRAHRMGQDKPVMVYRIVARGTIEEEILALHESKRDLVAGVMKGTEAAAKLSNDDLIRMLRGE